MMKSDELLSMVESLPVDMKTQLIDRLLNSLNPAQKEIDELWAQESEDRVEEIRTGKVKPFDGEAVFDKIKQRLSK